MMPTIDTRDRIALSAKDVATLLGLSVRTVWRLVSTGDLPAPRGGSGV